MPRGNWKGVISFGLVNIPIILFNSDDTQEKVSFHQIDKQNNARIKYLRVNAETGKEVPWENIIKGYQYDKNTILPLEEDEISYVANENHHTIEIEQFIDKDNIDFINVKKTYYLVPDKKGEKGYVLLREALKGTNKIGIAKVVITTKEYLSAIAIYKNTLVLYLLKYQTEIKSLKDFNVPIESLEKVKATKKELEIAKKLLSSMTSKWRPEKYKDEYAEIIHKWANKKIKNIPISKKAKPKSQKGSNVVDFVELLKKSLKEKKPAAKSKNVSKKSHSKRA